MNLFLLEQITKAGESSSVEFKTSTAQLSRACETICAFLNGKGGIILLGVKNNGQIVGQKISDRTHQEIAASLKRIEPPASEEMEIHYVALEKEHEAIAIKVSPGLHAPYTYDGRPYMRIESSTSLMPQHLYEQLLVRRGHQNHVWEDQPANGYNIEDLDHDEIRQTIKEGVDRNRISPETLNYDIRDILRTLKLTRENKLTQAAIVLYTKEVRPDYNQCMIRMARFKGTDNLGDFIDNQRVHGHAFHIISAATDFVLRHLPISSFFVPGELKRQDQPAVPLLAFREGLINAICHRDYSHRNTSIALAIYDDRLELWNSGTLPSTLTLDDLRKQHQSYPRNEKIATIFYKRGWIEGWGTGTTRMISHCQRNGTPEPEFIEYSGGFGLIFRLKGSHEPPVLKHPRLPQEEKSLTQRQYEILLTLMTGNPMTLKNILQNLKNPPPERTLRDDLIRLKNRGMIQLEGRGRSAKWSTTTKK